MLRFLAILTTASLLSGANCLPATDVTVSVSNDGFETVDLEITSNQAFNTGASLSSTKPAAVTTEPSYLGERRLYGYFDLGTAADKRYYFSLDVISSSVVQMYFDVNHNGNLADDGGAILNHGSVLFAAPVSILFNQLVAESPFTSAFVVWVYGDNFLDGGDSAVLEHYSRTQLKGTVQLGGMEYTAYLADRGYNDADLTNDGIYIDLDNNGSIDDSTEWFESGQIVTINGSNYRFHIVW